MLQSFTQINWLVSLFAAVAMSVAANLLSSLFTRLFMRWSTRLASARERRLQSELAELTRYRDYSDLLNLVLGSVMRLLVFFSLASAVGTLGNLPERMVPETPSVLASGLSTLFYLMSVLQGMETLRKLTKLRQLNAARETL